jgi:hypothetical protein
MHRVPSFVCLFVPAAGNRQAAPRRAPFRMHSEGVPNGPSDILTVCLNYARLGNGLVCCYQVLCLSMNKHIFMISDNPAAHATPRTARIEKDWTWTRRNYA